MDPLTALSVSATLSRLIQTTSRLIVKFENTEKPAIPDKETALGFNEDLKLAIAIFEESGAVINSATSTVPISASICLKKCSMLVEKISTNCENVVTKTSKAMLKSKFQQDWANLVLRPLNELKDTAILLRHIASG